MRTPYEYLEYYHKLNDAEKIWVKNFYAAYYAPDTRDQRDDVYNRFTKADTTTEEIEQFMEKPVQLDRDFEAVYKREGFGEAAKFVVKNTVANIQNGSNPEKSLLEFYRQMKTLEKYKNAERRGSRI